MVRLKYLVCYVLQDGTDSIHLHTTMLTHKSLSEEVINEWEEVIRDVDEIPPDVIISYTCIYPLELVTEEEDDSPAT